MPNAVRDLLGTSLGVNTCIRRKTPALTPAAEAEALRQATEAPAPSTRQVARALRVAGRVDPIFVDDVQRLDQEILAAARDGDVVITMGAGSIGSVAGRVVTLAGGAGPGASEEGGA